MTNTQRREVVVNGQRVRVIDMHAHVSIPEAMSLMGQRTLQRITADTGQGLST